MYPLNRRIVLDLARQRILQISGYPKETKWFQVRGEELCMQLPVRPFRPPNEILSLLYTQSKIRDAGDEVARNADKEHLISCYDGPERKALETLFEFIFE